MEKRHPIFNRFKSLMRIFKKRPEILDLTTGENKTGIIIANHSGASGPFTYQLYFPRKNVPWGAHEMCGNYKERWNYLYYVFYQQKLHYGKIKSFLIATPFAVISKMLYNGAELIPTYRDGRLRNTIKNSLEILKEGRNILIFPENSTNGYEEILTEYHGGFITLAKIFFERTGEDLPIYPVYYSAKFNKMVIDKPLYIQKLIKEENIPPRELANIFKDKTNDLYFKHIINS